MFNVTILKIRDLVKYIFISTIAVAAIVFLLKINNKKNSTLSLSSTAPIVFKAEGTEEKVQNKTEDDYMKEIIKEQISSIDEVEKSQQDAENITEVESEAKPENAQEEKVDVNAKEEIPLTLPTEVVTQNPIQEKFNSQYENIKIKNETDYNLTNEMLTPDVTIENKNVLIFHTHTCESYTASDAYPYVPTGSFRTSDLNFSVARVGTELETFLTKAGISVEHDVTYHDYPAYNGSYTRSLNTVTNLLQNRPADIIIDLHRDAVGSRSDYAPTVKIGEEYAAQIMFVIGTNNGGLEHPNWNQNLKFAIKLQQKAEEMYPRII